MSGHTPGPWKVIATFNSPRRGIKGPQSQDLLAEVFHCQQKWGFENARLIAAAPDLLLAAKSALHTWVPADAVTYDELKSAIAKAEGKD